MTVLHSCTCESPYQDRLYGKGMRLMNGCKKPSEARCTICSRVVVIGSSSEKGK